MIVRRVANDLSAGVVKVDEPPLFSKNLDDLLPPDSKSSGGKHIAGRSSAGYAHYEDVPWYRREPGALSLLLALVFAPVTIALCIIALTGDVYKQERDENGKLKVWGAGNKAAAVLLLALQGYVLWRYFGPQ